MKKIIFALIFCSLLVTTNSYGQKYGYFSAQYAVSFGMGDLGEYISNVSWRGIQLEYKKGVNDNILAGMEVGWNVFYEKKDHDTYSEGTRSLSGVQYRYQNAVPMLGTIDYLISPDNLLTPYIGLGIGTIYNERVVDMGLYRITQDSWQFALKGELGLLYEISYASSIKLAAKYFNGFKTDALDSQGYLSIVLGMAWHL